MYETVASELESVLAAWDYEGRTPPAFVTRRIRRYLRCGRPEWGFVRVYCSTCRDDTIVDLSGKDRAICPSCTGRRMSSTAANLVQRVIPEQDVRQYVLTVPYQLRARLAYNPDDRRSSNCRHPTGRGRTQ